MSAFSPRARASEGLKIQILKMNENEEDSSSHSSSPESDARARERAQAALDSGWLDDFKAARMVTLVTQKRDPSPAQLEALAECEAFVAGMNANRERRQAREAEETTAATERARSLAEVQGFWSVGEMRTRLEALVKVRAGRGGPGAIPALDETIADLEARLARVGA